MPITRLAPSPTGALHLGNARTFLINWLLARQLGWTIVLRIEDLDGPRVKADADAQAIEDLRWLGFDWDEGPVKQSTRSQAYQAARDQLIADAFAYPCVCSRKEVERAASAPHAEDGSTVYPGTCRGKFTSIDEARAQSGRDPAIRFRVPDETISWNDAFAGRQAINVTSLGDFVIAKSDGTAAYQLAVVVDDSDSGVTHVVRGDDLLDSTPRQILLYRALSRSDCIPNYCHLPLVLGTDGRRLAKRHGDTRLSFYRQSGVKSERVLAMLARWCGIEVQDQVRAADLISRFDLKSLSHHPIEFDQESDRWLRKT